MHKLSNYVLDLIILYFTDCSMCYSLTYLIVHHCSFGIQKASAGGISKKPKIGVKVSSIFGSDSDEET